MFAGKIILYRPFVQSIVLPLLFLYTYRIIMVQYVLTRIISTLYTSNWLDGLAALLFNSPVGKLKTALIGKS